MTQFELTKVTIGALLLWNKKVHSYKNKIFIVLYSIMCEEFTAFDKTWLSIDRCDSWDNIVSSVGHFAEKRMYYAIIFYDISSAWDSVQEIKFDILLNLLKLNLIALV